MDKDKFKRCNKTTLNCIHMYMEGTLLWNIHSIHTINTYHKSIIIYVLLCFQHSVVLNQLKRTCFHVIEDNEFEFCRFSLDQHHTTSSQYHHHHYMNSSHTECSPLHSPPDSIRIHYIIICHVSRQEDSHSEDMFHCSFPTHTHI